MYDMYSMNDTNKIDWEVFAALVLNCLDEQKVMIQELSQKVDELGKYSKESENYIKSDTDQLIGELTDRVSNLEAFDTRWFLQQQEDAIKKCKNDISIALNRTQMLNASIGEMKRKLQGIKR